MVSWHSLFSSAKQHSSSHPPNNILVLYPHSILANSSYGSQLMKTFLVYVKFIKLISIGVSLWIWGYFDGFISTGGILGVKIDFWNVVHLVHYRFDARYMDIYIINFMVLVKWKSFKFNWIGSQFSMINKSRIVVAV